MWARTYGTGKKKQVKNQTRSELYQIEDNGTVIEIDKAQEKKMGQDGGKFEDNIRNECTCNALQKQKGGVLK